MKHFAYYSNCVHWTIRNVLNWYRYYFWFYCVYSCRFHVLLYLFWFYYFNSIAFSVLTCFRLISIFPLNRSRRIDILKPRLRFRRFHNRRKIWQGRENWFKLSWIVPSICNMIRQHFFNTNWLKLVLFVGFSIWPTLFLDSPSFFFH